MAPWVGTNPQPTAPKKRKPANQRFHYDVIDLDTDDEGGSAARVFAKRRLVAANTPCSLIATTSVALRLLLLQPLVALRETMVFAPSGKNSRNFHTLGYEIGNFQKLVFFHTQMVLFQTLKKFYFFSYLCTTISYLVNYFFRR